LVMRIVTDSRRPEEPKDPEQCNVFALYRHFAPIADVAWMKKRYLSGGLAYKEIKEALFVVLDERFFPVRERFAEILADPGHLHGVLHDGGIKARHRARQTLARVRRAMGFEDFDRAESTRRTIITA